jgi:hypothetical protein
MVLDLLQVRSSKGGACPVHVPPCNPSTVTMTMCHCSNDVAQEELLANDNPGDEDDIEDIGDEVPRTPPIEDRILVQGTSSSDDK